MKLWDLRLFSEQDGLEEARRAVKEQHWDYRYERPRLAKVGGSFSILSPYRYRYFFVGSGAATGVAKGWRGGGCSDATPEPIGGSTFWSEPV